ncbi:Heat shock 70 kDa protein-like 2 [Homarus americanus]|uniref:Heat shock 70 kDa protein-like 2 n=1 Tax=Homarus americanus TaxID=6706 RepID=A0A8J5KG30_HOMAM|nr:Heat shock 70 kDa protein-like 2 [Homarus americanus]
MKSSLREEGVSGRLTQEENQGVTDLVDHTLTWLDNNQLANKEQLETQLRKLEDHWRPVAAKIHGSSSPGEGTTEANATRERGPTVKEVD